MKRHVSIWYCISQSSHPRLLVLRFFQVARLKTWRFSKHPDSQGMLPGVFFAFYNITNKHFSVCTYWTNYNLFENLLGYDFEEKNRLPQLGRCFQRQPKAAKPLVSPGLVFVDLEWYRWPVLKTADSLLGIQAQRSLGEWALSVSHWVGLWSFYDPF